MKRRYFPSGINTRPLVIGDLLPGGTLHVFESQWDGFAFMDASGERSGIVITRGASNGALIADAILQDVIILFVAAERRARPEVGEGYFPQNTKYLCRQDRQDSIAI